MSHSMGLASGPRGKIAPRDDSPRSPLGGLDIHREMQRHLSHATARPHIVQFYQDDGFLCDSVAQFAGSGLVVGEPMVVIATDAHRRAIKERLEHNAIDVGKAISLGRYIELDARDTLATFMVDGTPDWDRFSRGIGEVIESAGLRPESARIRAYGEMVNLLWQDGDFDGAIRLEEMWNRLAATHAFSLLCAYAMGNFLQSGDADRFREVCEEHSHVVPADGYAKLETPDARLREISLLQQRAQSLEWEIEQRKALESTLREALSRETAARTEAERTVHYNEMFAGILGHDLRNPLNTIATAAYYITRANSDSKTKTAATRIVSSSERMARMIEQLLDFTRIRIGDGLALRPEPIDLAELCHRIKDEIEVAHPECRIAVVTQGEVTGEWDRDRLLQAISNIAGNAVDHGTTGCTIRIGANGTDADAVVVTVHNDGAISPEVLPVLFEPFRGSTTSQRACGLGLGLYITHQIVTAHGGSIDVRSSDAEGTTVRMALPRARGLGG